MEARPSSPRPRPSLRTFASALCAMVSVALLASFVLFAVTAPNEVRQPGTQPGQVAQLSAATNCDNCHGGYDLAVEPAHNWRAGMMAHAGRDPLFWAAMAVAEETYDGVGDFCLRCHAPRGWLAGRASPTEGSALTADDGEGVLCHLCHRLTNPDGSEIAGVQSAPYLAHDEGAPAQGYYGSGMFVLNAADVRLGPYSNAAAPHAFMPSQFHRSSKLCGTCHDVSNPLVGDLAPGNGANTPLPPGTFAGTPGAPIGTQAAFNAFPHQYGASERTFSEHQSSAFATLRVSDYATLPAELQDGSIQEARDFAYAGGANGNYADGTVRTFSCQTCHMRPITGKGCNQNQAPVRTDVPLHDQTGGNTWAPAAILYLNGLNRLRLGGALTADEIAALNTSAARARQNLQTAASLSVTGNTLRVTNLTGHKLISGFPEGRRMWVQIRWRDAANALVREDGAYGALSVTLPGGAPGVVETLLDLSGANTRIYHAEPGLSQAWAAKMLTLGFPANLPLEYDRVSGAATRTLGALAAQPPGTVWASFHFALNDALVTDTRIPPYGMSYDAARERNCLPVPDTQYGNPGAGGVYRCWDELALSPPAAAVTAEIRLLYQTTSWEYVQFLRLANSGTDPFLGQQGDYLLDAWLNTGMSAPEVMATATWTAPLPPVSAFCAGDGSLAMPCPCGNTGGAGRGCANSTNAAGALLAWSGAPMPDTLVLQGSGMPASVSCIYLQGDQTTPAGIVFGDGVRCASGSLVRLRTKNNVAGASQFPDSTDTVTVSQRGGVVPGSGVLRAYQTYYRNASSAFCPPETFNVTNGLLVVW